MRRFLAFLLLTVPTAYAQVQIDDSFLDGVVRPDAPQTKKVARAQFRILEFANNRLTDIDLTANQSVSFKELSLELKGCLATYDKVEDQDVAWLNVKELPADSALSPVPLFSGWMFNSFPDASTLDHPKYDVRLVQCLEPEVLPVTTSYNDGQPLIEEREDDEALDDPIIEEPPTTSIQE